MSTLIPTLLSLGIQSPFIVFRTEQEVLSNNSVLLNLTDIRNKLKSVHNLDHFIRPIDGNADNKNARKDPFAPKGVVGRLGTAGSSINPPAEPPVFSAESAFSSSNVSITFLTTVAPSFVNHFEKNNGYEGQHGARPILSIRSQPHTPSVLGSGDHMISDDDGGSGNGKKERKYIIPLALKTSTNEKEKTSSVFHGSSTNIDDLKRHILMLQNLTQSDKNFQSKFVVFPSLQKNGTEKIAQTTATTAPATVSPHHLPMAGSASKDVKEHRNFGPSNWGQSTKGDTNATNNRSVVRSQISTSINMPKKAFPDSHDIMSDRKEEGLQAFKAEKITIVPQVFLQNDQTSETVSDKENNLKESGNNRAATDSTKMTAQSQIENGPPFTRMRETKEKNVIRKFGHKSMASASSKSEHRSGFGPEGGAHGIARNNQTVLTTPHTKTSGTTNKGFPIRAGSVGIDEQRWNMNGPQLNGTSLASAKTSTAKGEGKKKPRKNGKRRGGKRTIKPNGPNEQPKSVILNDDATVLQMDDIQRTSSSGVYRQEGAGVRPTKSGRSAGSRKRSPSSSRVRRNENGGTQQAVIKQQQQQQLYASSGRSHGPIGRDGRYESRMAAVSSLESLATTTDHLAGERFGENNNRSHNYRNRTLSADGTEKDIVDLNPELCYTLSALSGGQQKLCAQHTSIMPAISRGARAAIQ
uniref:Uncharacterized protein n=1 Tax=Anopheles minimus TaxID=112268 RepID=A0A182VSR5_9DIPT